MIGQGNSFQTVQGDDMNKKILLYLSIMMLGLYVMPNTVSLFAGQHSFYSGMGVSCEKCHSDVLSQVTSGYVYQKHKAAAENTNYTTYLSLGGISYNDTSITDYNNIVWKWNTTERKWQNSSNPAEMVNISLDKGGNPGIDGDEICMLCHNATLFGASTHTGTIVRVCDDDRCHGNRNGSSNSPQLFGINTTLITAVGLNLSHPNVHQSFYLQASNQSSRYAAGQTFGQTPGNANGSFISYGYWACEGCHTETLVNVTIIPAPAFNHSVSNPAKRRY